MPAYNAEATLRRTHAELPLDVVDTVILVDDASADATVAVARELGITVIAHPANRGYGGTQKTCYAAALESGADIVVMLHPDYQYTPRLIPAMAHLLACGEFDVVLGSRILGGRAIAGGMPRTKYVANRALTFVQNLLMGAKLSEFHTGYRAFSRRVLERVNWRRNSDDFVFDAQMLAQVLRAGFRVGEISCPARYFPEASSISLLRSIPYGLGCLAVSLSYRLDAWGLRRSALFASPGD
jgi:glycosyltransferase involved in cell wall biosynthesis